MYSKSSIRFITVWSAGTRKLVSNQLTYWTMSNDTRAFIFSSLGHMRIVAKKSRSLESKYDIAYRQTRITLSGIYKSSVHA